MAYTQTPGRGNGMKTGGGISSALLQKLTPKEKATNEKLKKEEERVDRAVNKYSSTKKMKGQELNIERAAAYDSIEASDKARDMNFTKREAAKIGNKSANATRKINDGATRVKRTEVVGKKGYEDKYERVKVTPAKQMSKLKSGKSPAKQVSKMPTNKLARDKRPTDTMERNRGGAEPTLRKPGGRTPDVNGTAPRPKANKKAPMKMKKC